MDYYFDTFIKKIEEYLVQYGSYSELEKLEKKSYISNCFDQVLDCRYIKFYDRELIEKLHTMILKLENLSALISFDTILIDYYYLEYKDSFIKDDIGNIVELAYKEIKPFIGFGLQNQLKVRNIDDAKPFNYNDNVLNRIGSSNAYVVNIHELLEYFEKILQDKNINVDIVSKFYHKLTSEQLAYVYSQFNYFEYSCGSFFSGEKDRCIYLYLEQIFDSLRIRNDLDKIEFMMTIRKLGYSNEFIGIVAMIVELLSTKKNEEICNILWDVCSTRLEGQYGDYGEDTTKILCYSKLIKELRDEDILKGNKLSTIFEYSIINNSKCRVK